MATRVSVVVARAAWGRSVLGRALGYGRRAGCVGVLATVFGIASAVASSGIARADDDPQTEARREMRQGIEALDAKDHESALAHCRRAVELVPEANLPHRCAARALEGLSRWQDAVGEYESYLRIKADVSDATTIRSHIDELRAAHLMGTVVLRCTPEGASVRVDGQDAGTVRELRLAAGPHRIQVRAPGHVARDLEVDVIASGVATPACVLEREPQPAPPPNPIFADPQRPDAGRGSPWYTKWWVWTGGAAVLAGTITTIVLLSRSPAGPPSTEGGNHSFPP